jgi:glucokinase
MRLGVDLGGTNIAAGLTDEKGALLCRHSNPTGVGRAREVILADICRTAVELCDKYGISPTEVDAIGIGVPGSVNKAECKMVFGTNLGMDQIYFEEVFRPAFSCPVFIDNDANCAALGECYGGAGIGCSSMVMVTLGTGIGGGLVFGGHVFSGCGDVAGEIGHMIIEVNGLPCNCGKRGCWEMYASATAVIRMIKQAMAEHPESLLHEIAKEQGKIGALNLFLARDRNDAVACELFDQYIRYLSVGIGNLIAILQPERVIIGGGIIGQGEKLLAPLRERVYAELMTAEGKRSEILAATAGNDAGIIGAAMLDS